jgi:hypothetical protein
VSFHIKELVLYGPRGQLRIIGFEPGFNVIAGEPGTGKSSVFEAIDYCLGADACGVASGIIRRTVRWYGLRLANSTGEMFVARKGPALSERSSTEAFYAVGTVVEAPPLSELVANTNASSLVKVLSDFAGIPENRIEPPGTSSRPAYAATVRHALFFLFQEQSEIASNRSLFHRQGEPGVAMATGDVLPFFLGATTEEHFRKRNELRRLSDVAKSLKGQIAETAAIESASQSTAGFLVAEAVDVGLLSPEAAKAAEDNVAALAALGLAGATSDDAVTQSVHALEDLFERQREFIARKRKLAEDLLAVHGVLREERDYLGERGEQKVRLSSIQLISPVSVRDTACPLCGGPLTEGTPSHDEVLDALTSLSEQLSELEKPNRGMQKLLASLRLELDEVNTELANVKQTIVAVRQSHDHAAKLWEQSQVQAMVLGRISLYLDTQEERPKGGSDLKRRLAETEQAIDALSAETSEQGLAEQTQRISSILDHDLTELAQHLGLEHSQNVVRLDTRKLTVVAETSQESIPLYRMGSGANHVRYHVVAHLALQKWFVSQRRPVPRFLLLDQPSQAFFPPELPDGDLRDLATQERQWVHDMLKLVCDVSNALDDGFQCLLVEHAFFDEPWFSDAVRARWYGGEKLIPCEWDNEAVPEQEQAAD